MCVYIYIINIYVWVWKIAKMVDPQVTMGSILTCSNDLDDLGLPPWLNGNLQGRWKSESVILLPIKIHSQSGSESTSVGSFPLQMSLKPCTAAVSGHFWTDTVQTLAEKSLKNVGDADGILMLEASVNQLWDSFPGPGSHWKPWFRLDIAEEDGDFGWDASWDNSKKKRLGPICAGNLDSLKKWGWNLSNWDVSQIWIFKWRWTFHNMNRALDSPSAHEFLEHG